MGNLLPLSCLLPRRSRIRSMLLQSSSTPMDSRRKKEELKLHLENQLMHCLQILIVILSAIPCDQQCFETSLNSLDFDKVYPRIWCCDYKALAV